MIPPWEDFAPTGEQWDRLLGEAERCLPVPADNAIPKIKLAETH